MICPRWQLLFDDACSAPESLLQVDGVLVAVREELFRVVLLMEGRFSLATFPMPRPTMPDPPSGRPGPSRPMPTHHVILCDKHVLPYQSAKPNQTAKCLLRSLLNNESLLDLIKSFTVDFKCVLSRCRTHCRSDEKNTQV